MKIRLPERIIGTSLSGLAVALGLILTVHPPVFANYIAPKTSEYYMVVTNNWKILTEPDKSATNYSGNERHIIEVTRDAKTFKFPVDSFRVVESTDSNAICCGGGDKVYKKAMDELRSFTGSEVQFALVSRDYNAPLMVASFHKANIDEGYETALQHGSTLLNLSARQMHALKGKDDYKQKLRAVYDANWATIAKPVRVAKPPKPAPHDPRLLMED